MSIFLKMFERYTPHVFLILFLSTIAVLGAAYIFQYGFGYAPCELCYYQRYPYMAVIALSGLGLIDHKNIIKLNKSVLVFILFICALLLVTDASIAAYHAGVEYKWWLGPSACTSTVTLGGSIEEQLAQLMSAPIIRCDQAPWSLFGISMAGYNFFIASFLSLFAIVSWSNLKK